MSTKSGKRAWVEVDGAAVRRNLRTIAAAVGPDVALIPMVKADAYGLGVARALRAMQPEDPWGYGVASVDEGIELRELGVSRPVLVFSPVPPASYLPALERGLTLCLSNGEAIRALIACARGREGDFQLEVDTGIGRAGLDWRRASTCAPLLEEARAAGLRWTGCYSHLHSADVAGTDSVRIQLDRFHEALDALSVPTDDPGFLVHIANSAAALRSPETGLNAVRPGIFLYGGSAGAELPEPEPVASVRAAVVRVRDAAPGTTLGYGATHVAEGPERWATVGIGYGDGLPRSLGNRGHALLHGRRARIIGRISMDMTVVDITGLPTTEVGDTATFVGADGNERITLEEVAELASTINYEILTGLTSRLPRRWTDA